LVDDIRQTKNRVRDRATRAHLADAEVRIEQILDPSE
jgi:hypothetical protein